MKTLLDIKTGEMIRFPEGISVEALSCEEDVTLTLYHHDGRALGVVRPGVLTRPVTMIFGLVSSAPIKRLIVE